jgi:hypothetical protein
MKNLCWFHFLFHWEFDDTVLIYARSDKVGHHLVLAVMRMATYQAVSAVLLISHAAEYEFELESFPKVLEKSETYSCGITVSCVIMTRPRGHLSLNHQFRYFFCRKLRPLKRNYHFRNLKRKVVVSQRRITYYTYIILILFLLTMFSADGVAV